MQLRDFDFDLPDEAIARFPADRRDQSRLMVLRRRDESIEHHRFCDLPDLLLPHDLLVLNDTRVQKARILGKKHPTGGAVEILLVTELDRPTRWRALVRSSKGMHHGQEIRIGPSAHARVDSVESDGFCILELSEPGTDLARTWGTLPLPPYLRRAAEALDEVRYQTVYATEGTPRSVAAPTAGLHFTDEVFSALLARKIAHARVTLDVGPGTFLPVRTESIASHTMHAESYSVTKEAADAIEAARRRHQVVAVGTTVVRVLESASAAIEPGLGSTQLFIRPGFHFRIVDKLITNFHLPRSTLLMLACAFGGHAFVMAAYETAVREKYRFFSYGDAMLIL